jgi:hypothetical protein
MSHDNFDEFNDVRRKTRGCFGGDAWDEHESCKSQLGPRGLTTEMPCGGCGAPKQLLIDWGELVAIRCHVSPARAYGAGASDWVQVHPRLVAQAGAQGEHWSPYNSLCGRCQKPLEMLLSPAEASAHVTNGIRSGWLHPQQEQQLGTACVRAGGWVPKQGQPRR